MTAYDFWVLDLDGTVVSVTESYILETMDRVGAALERTFSEQEAVAVWYGRDGLRDELLRGKDVEPARFWEAFHRIESPEDRAAATTIYPDADAVRTLEGPRGVVTHCQPYLLEPILDRLEIREWFDTVVCCSDSLGWKPDPRPVRRAMADIEVNGGDGALVGDSMADIGAARNVGLDAILVDRDGDLEIDGADRVVASLEELV